MAGRFIAGCCIKCEDCGACHSEREHNDFLFPEDYRPSEPTDPSETACRLCNDNGCDNCLPF